MGEYGQGIRECIFIKVRYPIAKSRGILYNDLHTNIHSVNKEWKK